MATEHHPGPEPQIPFEATARPHSESALEPVTPPTSKHQPSFYPPHAHRYAGFNQSGLEASSPFSPSLMPRDAALPPLGSSTNQPFTSSPADLNTAKAYNPPTQSYLATPNTPKQPRAATQAFTSTPIGSLHLNARNSFPAAGVASGVHPTAHRTSQPLAATVPGSAPIGHSRSYSYNTVDPQAGLQRLSISLQPPTKAGATSPEYLRPRAYSLGIAPMNGTAMTGAFGVALDPNSHAFPAPLSSPISPDNHISGSNLTPRLRSFNHVFPPGSAGEDQFASSNLYRSMSTTSLKTPGHALPRPPSDPHSVGDALHHQSRNAAGHPNRPYHSRRSSSSGSSADGSALAAIGSMTPLNTAKDAAAGAGPQVDLESCTDAEIHALCRDQRGCRFLQRKLLESSPATIRQIFRVTSPHIVTLMVDPFGNYFCQKLFELCTESEIHTLLTIAADSLPGIANNQHGTRALQRLIDVVSTAEHQKIIVAALDGHVVRLIRDINGNHVIQKLLLTLNETGSQFIYDAVCESVIEIGSHRHGCCVLQRCLDYAKEGNRRKLVQHIVAQALILVCDPFGNYVCQYVIDLGSQEFTDSLANQLRGRIAKLSIQKFSSNVVEKCLRAASPPLQRDVVAELMEPATLNELLLDNYGNYVIQTALECMSSLDPSAKQALSRDICNALTVTRSPYGRRIMSKLKSW